MARLSLRSGKAVANPKLRARTPVLAALLTATVVVGLGPVFRGPLSGQTRPLVFAQPPGGREQANCGSTALGLTPLTELGSASYEGVEGGLYPGGINHSPAAYERAGLERTRLVVPRDQSGQPSSAGSIVLLSLGMSNAAQEFSAFKRQADIDPRKNPRVVVVNGARGGQDAVRIASPSAPYWAMVDKALSDTGVSREQVQVVWLKEAIAGEREPFPADARRLEQALASAVEVAARRYPNLQIVYVSSRTYGGYASTRLNPEPVAYESGFAVKWLIAEHIRSGAGGPWVAWGPYLWTDGTRGRSDGLVWTCEDVRADGTHPSPSGMRKAGELLLEFFTTEETAKSWFVRKPTP